MTVLAAVVVLVGLLALMVCAVGGGVELFMCIRREDVIDGYPSRMHAAVQLAAAAALAVIPFVSAGLAESATGWVDPDGDGMLGDMANGGYDYLDINGGTWIQTWGWMTVFVLTGLVIGLRLVSHRSNEARRPG